MSPNNCDKCGHDRSMCDCSQTANDMQIGGNHYKIDYEHWDWCIDINLGYLEGNATKYISRWRKKGGVQDLNKALHYLTKALEAKLERRYRNHSYHNASTPRIKDDANNQTAFFISEQSHLTHIEKNILFRTAIWRTEDELTEVIDLLRNFIAVVIAEEKRNSIEQEDSKLEERPKRTRASRINHPAPFGYTDEEN